MKLYITFTRSKLLAILAAFILVLNVYSQFAATAVEQKDGQTNALRLEFAQSIGCTVEETCLEEKTVVIPYRFSQVYENYNAVQKQAGYDLGLYRGCTVTRYSYKVLSYGGTVNNTVLNLLVYKGVIIGGDISSVELNGKMFPLCKP